MGRNYFWYLFILCQKSAKYYRAHINVSQQQNIFFSRMNRPSDDSSRRIIPVQFWELLALGLALLQSPSGSQGANNTLAQAWRIEMFHFFNGWVQFQKLLELFLSDAKGENKCVLISD